MNSIFRLKQYLRYQWQAQTKYYIHSPFVFPFYLNVLEGKDNEALNRIRLFRQQLQGDNTIINIDDLGTGTSASKMASDIVRTSAIPHKYGRVLYRLAAYFQPQNILELGTSLGISSAYLALGNPLARVITLEGSNELAAFAAKNHAALQIQNVEIAVANFKDSLPVALANVATMDFVFFDGNHHKEATLNYFQLCLEKANAKTIFVFDDIYWSPEMSEAWQIIKQYPRITLAIDIYRMGICFFTTDKLAKEDFVLRY